MDKKWNKWLIIGGIIVLTLFFTIGKLIIEANAGADALGIIFIYPIIFGALIAISFGVVNYIDSNGWMKLLLTAIGVVVLFGIITLLINLFLPSWT